MKREITVSMQPKGYKQREIQECLSVSSGFISKWTQIFTMQGVSALKLAYKGSVGYLKLEERAAIIDGVRKKYGNLGELKAYIEERYEIVFSSQQSYYEIFDSAGLSWKKSQKRNPKTDPELVKKNLRSDPMVIGSSPRNRIR
ncbi:winged helix-turn-helix domain-containing protein [Microcoleus sp. Pol12A5]|uniref:winged helix-turn-helix domain-containing protein n=1 Tax=Microcoleus sp. Pol12A5 TaxID=3055392 RepID=UPI002FD13CBA